MGLDLLDNPIRVTWDLHGPEFCMAESDVTVVLERLLDARLFFTTLEQTPLAHPQCAEILHQLTDAGVQTLLLSDGSEFELAQLQFTENLPISLLINLQPFLSSQGVDEKRLAHVVETIRNHAINPGFSMTPLKSNIGSLESLLKFCKELKIPRFKLPNIRIDDNFQQSGKGQVLGPDDLEAVRRNLPDIRSLVEDIDLEIHDLFLWELLTPESEGGRSEYGGCQAGNSLAHVTYDGSVLPCVTWPEPLGSLLSQSFSDIWSSAKRHAIRQQVADKPEGCVKCRDYQLCFGGCRGLSSVLDIDGGLDPMCSGSR